MTSPDDLVRRLVSASPEPLVAEGPLDFWTKSAPTLSALAEAAEPHPVDAAVTLGFVADRTAYAFVAGYRIALGSVVPGLPSGQLVSLCATEEKGNHPRAIETRLERVEGGYELSGSKRWSTLATMAATLLVVASEGQDDEGRNRLRIAQVAADAPGISRRPMPPTPFMPEVEHAELELDRVSVPESAVLPGDGYARLLKPFRTVEDTCVNAAIFGYLFAVGRRANWDDDVLERLLTVIVGLRAVGAPLASESHLVLAGVLSTASRLIEELDWSVVDDDVRARWERDRAVSAVAGKARAARRQRAWERLRD